MAVKRILRYLVHTPNLGLWYSKGSTFDLLGYSDSDYAGYKVDRKSSTGTCQFLCAHWIVIEWEVSIMNHIILLDRQIPHNFMLINLLLKEFQTNTKTVMALDFTISFCNRILSFSTSHDMIRTYLWIQYYELRF